MKNFPLLLGAIALTALGCQRIPPSVSIPGYEEKAAAAEQAGGRPLGAAENPPEFFGNQDEE